MNEEEIRWIVDNLFIGNKLARGEVKAAPGTYIDLKAIRSPIVIFSSKGDNITPPQQAINWIADVYSSTAEIKANGQVIVGLLQEDVGHLGIFVSGKVAQKEHTEIIEALDYIEMLRPGLLRHGARRRHLARARTSISRASGRFNWKISGGSTACSARTRSPLRSSPRCRPEREGLLALRQAHCQEYGQRETAKLGRTLHPLRVQRWFFSDLNPMMWPLPAMA